MISDISRRTPIPTSRHGGGITANLSLRTDSLDNVEEYYMTMISRHTKTVVELGLHWRWLTTRTQLDLS